MTSYCIPDAAADLAAVAALLEIGERLGVSDLLDCQEPATVAEFAARAGTAEQPMASYLAALTAAGLAEQLAPDGSGAKFRGAPDIGEFRYAAGYLSWAIDANRPLLAHAREFFRDPATATVRHSRDGVRVAVSAAWIGSLGFYPGITAAVLARPPAKLVDLGAGAGGLLIRLLRELPESKGVALDINVAACEEARRAAAAAGMAGRLSVVACAIESLVADPSPIEGADLIHAGFVMHDLVASGAAPEVLATCRTILAPGGRVIVTDAVPNVPDERERRFSALFSYLHASFMNVQLPTEQEWIDLFAKAGFSDISAQPQRLPGGRLFIAVK
ncbi:MAG TPA: methyltransferase [Streptosporangiaceae bacterium]|nr:methyltransferase [Streptosporangiaceae bacterium]